MCANISYSYEWGYTYGPPMAVAPVGAVRRVVEFALTQMDAAKILLGFPNYAYDWTLPFVKGNAAQAISNNRAIELARERSRSAMRLRRCSPRSTAPRFSSTRSRRRRISRTWTKPGSRTRSGSRTCAARRRSSRFCRNTDFWASATGISCGRLRPDSACRTTCLQPPGCVDKFRAV